MLSLPVENNEKIENDNNSKNLTYNSSMDITYKLIFMHFDKEFKTIMSIDSNIYTPVALKTRIVQQYLNDFINLHAPILVNRSAIVKELFILHQTAKTLHKYNDEILHLSYNEFRAKFYFPNILFLLIRFLPAAKKFIQQNIKSVYSSIKNKSSGIISLHENSIHLDKDVIKSDILYNFLGNTIKKFNPFNIHNIWAFYKKAFLKIFHYYFKSEQKIHSSWLSFWTLDEVLSDIAQVPTREIIYRDVLTNLQIGKYLTSSPTMDQIYFNYNVFKNVILNNEFQSVYFSVLSSGEKQNIPNNKYKLLKLHKEINIEDNINIEEIKKLPAIYRLLKSVRITTKHKPIFHHINTSMLASAVLDELMYPFKNLISDTHIYNLLDNISKNFANSVLNGEYINILTLQSIKFDQISFISQMQKFIRLCLLTKI